MQLVNSTIRVYIFSSFLSNESLFTKGILNVYFTLSKISGYFWYCEDGTINDRDD